MKSTTKKKILKIHGWLGLATGIVIFIVSVTGCCWVFKDEIQSLSALEYSIEKEDQPVISPTRAKEIAVGQIPDKEVHGVIYKTPVDPIEVVYYEAAPEFYSSVFIQPYTGEILETRDHTQGFFAFVLDGHLRLWLPDGIGNNIVTFSVLFFLVILITGIILWRPKKRKGYKQRLRFLWKPTTGWRRKNFDLHSIIGFYVSLFAFTLAFTGCVMGFNWFYFLVYKAAGGSNAPQFIIPVGEKYLAESQEILKPIDRVLYRLQEEYPDVESLELHFPTNDTSAIYVEVSNTEGVYYDSDYRFYDQQTLKELPTTSIYGVYQEASFADKIIRMNYDIHIGAIGGFMGKLVAFIMSLISASLPVTGVLLWYGRNRKEKSKNKTAIIKSSTFSDKIETFSS